MNHAVLAGQNLHERAEVRRANDFARVDFADFDVFGHFLNLADRRVRRVAVARADNHRAVFLNVHARARLFGDGADRLAAGAYHHAYLVDGDPYRLHARRVAAHLAPMLRNRLGDVGEDDPARLPRLMQRVVDHVVADALDLHVQLNRGYPRGGAGYLEVHVSHVVFLALNVGQGDVPAALAGDKPYGDAGDGRLDGDAGVHERERAGADGSHRGGAVGAEALAHEPNRVGELVLAGNDGRQRALGERAVSNLAPSGRAGRARLAGRERREVVVEHEALGVFGAQVVYLLRVAHGAEGADAENLRLAAREQPRPVRARQQPNLAGDGADFGKPASVRALAGVENALLERRLKRLVERRRDERRFVLIAVLLGDFRAYLGGLGVRFIVGQRQRFRQPLGCVLRHFRGEIGVVAARDVLHLGLAEFGGEALLQLDDFQIDLLGALDGLQDQVFGHFARARLHHYDAGARAGYHKVEGAALDFLIRGVDGELAVYEPHARGGDGALERYFREGERGGGADNRHHVVGVCGVRRQRGGDYLDFVSEVFGEERPDGPVGEPRDEDGVGGGPSLALEEAAGDFAARVEALFDVHGEGEEVYPLARRGGGRRDEQDVVEVFD